MAHVEKNWLGKKLKRIANTLSHNQHKVFLRTLVTVAGVALIGLGMQGLWRWYDATHHIAPPFQLAKTVTHSTDHPSESPVKIADYTVPATQPRQITISSAGIKGYIQKVGIDQHNAVGVPNNINLAGWYTESVPPGDPGVSIIDGHVQGYYNPGIFKRLGQVKKGDVVDVEFGDHSYQHFVVIDTELYDVTEASSEQYRQLDGIKNQLTLITCGGAYDRQTREYPKRIIVRAKLSS